MTQGSNPLIVPEQPDTETLRVPVLKIFDGDGFLTRLKSDRRKLELEASVRFGFIDAPEMGQQGGPEARDFLDSLIGGRHVELAILYKSDTGKIIDRHNRIVGVPYLTAPVLPENGPPVGGLRSLIESFWEQRHLTRNIELEMVLNGWAWVLERYGPDERYMDAFSDARWHRRGIWAMEGNIPPWQFKHLHHRQRRSPKKPLPQPMLFPSSVSGDSCPQMGCGGHMIERSGRYGAFWGCSNFPKCKRSMSQ